MADIADIGFRVDTNQLDAAKVKVEQLFNTVREQTQAVNQVNTSVQQLAQRVDSGSTRQIQAHARTRRAIQEAAAQAQIAAAQQVAAVKSVEDAVQRQTHILHNAYMNQQHQIQQVIVALQKMERAMRNTSRAQAEKAKETKRTSEVIEGFRTQLMATANTIAIMDGPLGGIASRFAALGVLLGRVTPMMAGIMIATSLLTLEVAKGIEEFRKMETSVLRVDKVLSNLQGRIAMTGGELNGLAREIAYSTLESIETVTGAINEIIGLPGVTAQNMEPILRASADAAAGGLGDIATVSRSVALALEDPERSLARLNRRIRVFTDNEIEALKSIRQTNGELAYQTAFLEKLNSVYGGVSTTFGTLDGNMDTLGQQIQTMRQALGQLAVDMLFLEQVTGKLTTVLMPLTDRLEVGLGVATFDKEIRIVEEEIALLKNQLENGIFANGIMWLLFGNPEQITSDRALAEITRLEEYIAAKQKEKAEREKTAEQEARTRRAEEAEAIGTLATQLDLRKAMTAEERALRIEMEKRGVADFDPDSIEGRLARRETERLLAAQDMDKLLEEADKLLSSTNDQIAANGLLAASRERLEGLSAPMRELEIMIMKLEATGEEIALLGQLKEVRERLRQSEAEETAAERAQAMAKAYSDAGESILVAVNNTRTLNETQELSAGAAARQAIIQKVINDQLMNGRQLTEEEIERRYGALLDTYAREVDAQEQVRLKKERMGEVTKVLETLQAEKIELDAQLVAMEALGVKTDQNGRRYQAIVDREVLLNSLKAAGIVLTEEEERALAAAAAEAYQIATGVDEASASIRAATALTNQWSSALASVASGISSAADQAFRDRRLLELLRGGATEIEASATVEADLAERRLRAVGRPSDVSEAEFEAQIAQARQGTYEAELSAGLSAQELSEYRESLKETTKDASKAEEEFAQKVRDLMLSLDPAAQAAFELSEKVSLLNEAQASGVITSEQYRNAVGQLAQEFEASQDPIANFYQELSKLQDPEMFKLTALENAQQALSDFLFDPFKDGIDGMVLQFANAMKRMYADALAAKLMQSVMGSMGLGGKTGADGGAAALTSAGAILSGSGRMLNTSAMALNQAAAALAASGGMSAGVPALAGGAGGGGTGFLGSLFGGIFGGLFDEGGYIAPGKFGIAGEKGPEIIAGPAAVTSRRDTASMMSQKAPELNAKIINVLDPSIVGQYLNSADGEKLILNVLSENGVI